MKKLILICASILVVGSAVACAWYANFQPRNFRNQVKITTRGEFRYVQSNGIPDHKIGRFPNRHNPNAVRPQRHNFRVPADPKAARTVTRFRLGPFGVAINGVPFDPGAAEFWNRDPRSGWQYEPLSGHIHLGLDRNNAHVQPNGAYHYHGLPVGLIEKRGGDKQMLLIGYAADGFPVYAQFGYSDPNNANSGLKKMKSSYRLKKGTRPGGPGGQYDGRFVEDYEYAKGTGDLDECNGRQGVTPEYPEGIYHYHLTENFPYVPRCFRGRPDSTFSRRGPPGGPPPRRK